jgi:hypothetical protein
VGWASEGFGYTEEVFGAADIDVGGAFGIVLTFGGAGHGGGVNDDIRSRLEDDGLDRVGVGEFEVYTLDRERESIQSAAVPGGDDGVSAGGEEGAEMASEGTGGAGDEDDGLHGLGFPLSIRSDRRSTAALRRPVLVWVYIWVLMMEA